MLTISKSQRFRFPRNRHHPDLQEEEEEVHPAAEEEEEEVMGQPALELEEWPVRLVAPS